MYPTEDQLELIAKWPHSDIDGLMAYIKDIWQYADWGWRQEGNRYFLSTAGWSGNEEIIQTMKENWMFWSLCWQSSRRGGHYEFTLPIGK